LRGASVDGPQTTAKQRDELLIVEGTPDFLAMATIAPEFPVMGIHGASGCPALYAAIRERAKSITIATHHDDTGIKYAAQFIGALIGKDVRRWRGIDGETKKDINDVLKERGADELLLSLKNAARCTETELRKDLPKIKVSHQLADVVDQAEKAIAADPQVYQRAGRLIIVTHIGEPAVHSMTAAMLRERLTRCANWKKIDKRSEKEENTTPPDHVVSALLERCEWPNVRELRGIYTHPYLKPGGTLATTNGYDEETKSLLLSDISIHIPDRPTQQEAIAAARELLAVVDDFDFINDAAGSVWLALILSLVARPAIDGPCSLALAASIRLISLIELLKDKATSINAASALLR